MNIKKQSAGVWVNLIAAILALASLIVYGVNISSEGYFQNATVSSMMNYGIPAIVLLVLVIVLAQLKLTGGAAAAVEVISGVMRIAIPVLLTLCLINLIPPELRAWVTSTSPMPMSPWRYRHRRTFPPPPAPSPT